MKKALPKSVVKPLADNADSGRAHRSIIWKGAHTLGDVMAAVGRRIESPGGVAPPPSPTQHGERVQRRFDFGDNGKYSGESSSLVKRNFRRDLMLTLAGLDFPERGTQRMWQQVEAWLADGKVHPAGNFKELVGALYDLGLMEKRIPQGASMGPRNLGGRPGFDSGVTRVLPLSADVAQARRHVISSSTLGRAIEEAPADLATLNQWLARHGLSEQPDTGNRGLDQYAARRQIWSRVHNHLGNLWVGDSMPNSAIGFIRGPIMAAAKRIREYMVQEDRDSVPVDGIVKALPNESPWKAELFAGTWNLVRSTLIEQLTQDADPSGNVDGVQAIALMIEWIRNADLDLPQAELGKDYFVRLSSIYGRLMFPTAEVFAPGGALDDFLALSPYGRRETATSSVDLKSSGVAIVPDEIDGVGQIRNVSGDGMNCLIRALLVAAGGQDQDSTVEALRQYLHSQGVADQANMLDLAGDAGAILISFMEAQGLLPGGRGLVVYTPGNMDPPIVVIGGDNPIAVWLSGDHFQAVVPDG